MLKQEMKVKKLKFYVLFPFIAVIQLSECKNIQSKEVLGDVNGDKPAVPDLVLTDDKTGVNGDIGDKPADPDLVLTDADGINADKPAVPDLVLTDGVNGDKPAVPDLVLTDGANGDKPAVPDLVLTDGVNGEKPADPDLVLTDGVNGEKPAVPDLVLTDGVNGEKPTVPDLVLTDGVNGDKPAVPDLVLTDGKNEDKLGDSDLVTSGKNEDKLGDSDLVTSGANEDKRNLVVTDEEKRKSKKSKLAKKAPGRCWISLKSKPFFRSLDQLYQKYKKELEAYAEEVDMEHLDKKMLDAMLRTRGAAERALQNFGGNPSVIPAGLNLGDHAILRMPGSLLFFYRLKLRNNTRFVVNYINNDVEHLTITLRLSLNDLHLVGQYERALTSQEDPSQLYYRPNKGGVEFLLKDVKYKVEGRYRLLEDRLHIEHIISEIPPMEILMRYTEDPHGQSTPLEHGSLKDYLQRMKNDLNEWLKDYFNDFLMLYGFDEAKKSSKVQEYHNQRTVLMNEFSDGAIEILNSRLRKLGAANLIMPDFTLTAANGMEIKLYDGAVLGVDTMYRRSIATGKQVDKVGYVDADIGFGGLRVQYRYNTFVRTGLPPLSGIFVLNTDDISAHMALQLVKIYPDSADLLVSFLRFGKPETLTVEGPANRVIANFKHLLEHHIISIMSSTLIHHIRSLSALVKCEPNLPGKDKPRSENSKEVTDEEKPVTDDEKPVTDDEKPVTDEEIRKTDEEKPVTDDEKPVTDEEKPVTDDEKPVTDDEKPVTDDEKPVTDEEKPVTDEEKPVTDDEKRKTDEEKPVTDDEKPVTDDEKPVTDEEKPVTDDEKPVTDEEKPVTDEEDMPPLTDDDFTKAQNYRVIREESIELELPPGRGSAKGQKMKLNYNETFVLKKLNNDGSVNPELDDLRGIKTSAQLQHHDSSDK